MVQSCHPLHLLSSPHGPGVWRLQYIEKDLTNSSCSAPTVASTMPLLLPTSQLTSQAHGTLAASWLAIRSTNCYRLKHHFDSFIQRFLSRMTHSTFLATIILLSRDILYSLEMGVTLSKGCQTLCLAWSQFCRTYWEIGWTMSDVRPVF